MLVGQVILRKSGVTPEGKQMYILCGVISTPLDASLDSEKQYVVVGKETDSNILLNVYKEGAIDRTEELKGTTPSQWLTSPIWSIQ